MTSALLRRRATTVAILLAINTPTTARAETRVSCLGKRATIVGTRGPDRLVGTARADVIAGLGGMDTIRGGGGEDLICGGGNRDAIAGGSGSDRIDAGPGDDTVYGNAGNDTVATGRGKDLATGGGGNDTISLGGGASNVVAGDAGDDEISGDSALDILSFAGATQGVIVDIAAGNATGDGADTLEGIDAVDGSPFDDTITGDPSTNFLSGAEGNDTIDSGGNHGTLETPDTLVKLNAFDVLLGDLSLFGFGLDEDVGDDTFIGGTGVNVVKYLGADEGVDVDLTTGIATGQGTDTLSQIQMVLGTEFDDTLRGDDQANAFEGEGGRDTIDGAGGQDIAMFLDANRAEADLVSGTATSIYPGENQPGSATLAGIEDIWGSFGPDTLDGGPFANRIFGMAGSDSIGGSAGDDHLDGGDGMADLLDGGLGTDTCVNGETSTGCEAGSVLQVPNEETDSGPAEHRSGSPWRYEARNETHQHRATQHGRERFPHRTALLRGQCPVGDQTSALDERAPAALAGRRADLVEVRTASTGPPHLFPMNRECLPDAFIGALMRVTGDHPESAAQRLSEAHASFIQIHGFTRGFEANVALHAPLRV